MPIRKRIVTTEEPTTIVHRDREVVVDRDPPMGLIAAVVGVVLLVAGLIGYYAWWGPNRTEVVVEQQPSVEGRAQPMESPEPTTTIVTPPTIVTTPPVTSPPNPPIIVNPPATNTEKTVIIERENANSGETSNTGEAGNTGEQTGTESTTGTTNQELSTTGN